MDFAGGFMIIYSVPTYFKNNDYDNILKLNNS